MASPGRLLDVVFGRWVGEQPARLDRDLAGVLLPQPLRALHRWLDGAGLIQPRFYFRLRGRAPASP